MKKKCVFVGFLAVVVWSITACGAMFSIDSVEASEPQIIVIKDEVVTPLERQTELEKVTDSKEKGVQDKKHFSVVDVTVEEQYELVHKDGGMVIQAHPYREAWYIPEIRLFPKSVDGVEVCNASHYGKDPGEDGRSAYDAKALAYADKHQLPYTGGSDIHNSGKLLYGGMEFSRKLVDVQDYIKAVLTREGRPIDYFSIRREKENEL